MEQFTRACFLVEVSNFYVFLLVEVPPTFPEHQPRITLTSLYHNDAQGAPLTQVCCWVGGNGQSAIVADPAQVARIVFVHCVLCVVSVCLSLCLSPSVCVVYVYHSLSVVTSHCLSPSSLSDVCISSPCLDMSSVSFYLYHPLTLCLHLSRFLPLSDPLSLSPSLTNPGPRRIPLLAAVAEH